MNASTPITLHESRFELLPERALYWPEKNALICSDLHWGRESFLQKQGFAVPDLSFERESKILSHLFRQYEVEEWWILGDFIHHPKGMHETLIQRMGDWMRQELTNGTLQKIRFVPGNHDRALEKWSGSLPLQIEAKGIQVDGFSFLHEPKKNQEGFTWYGHLHPSVYLPLMGNDKLPCFWVREKEAYLPAFSRLAGGMEINSRLEQDRVFVATPEKVIEL